jgi:hypothetical protein
MVLAGMTGKNADYRELNMVLTRIDRAEVLKRIHGSLLGVVELLSLRAPTENPYRALVAAKANLSILEER